MTKWKLLKRAKTQEETGMEVEMITKEVKEPRKPEDTRPPFNKEPDEIPIKEYQETLYSKDIPPKKRTAQSEETKEPLKRTRWESAGIVEHNVDAMEKKPAVSKENGIQTSSTINKKVDRILSKKKNQP